MISSMPKPLPSAVVIVAFSVSAFQPTYAFRELVEILEPRRVAPEPPRLLGVERTRIHARLVYGARHHGPPRDYDVVADRQVPGDPHHPGDHTAAANRRAAGNTRATGDHGVRSDTHVVPDLHLVVDPDALLDHSVADGPAVDVRVRANLDVVADHDCAELRHLDVATGVGRLAEAVGSDHAAGMQQAARTDAHVVAQYDFRHEPRVFGDARAGKDHAS